MPTKKRRVGFIPRNDVLDLINKLSFESNLSISKIISILVEEALYKRGIFNINNGKVINYQSQINFDKENQILVKNDYKDFSNGFNNFKNNENQHFNNSSDEFIDKEIYEKFLMFLQFQEKMKKRN
tara:strand:+ start:279 stop:656 length:378 start_codon:yes stop_codon:yes gene_type:complete